jgi:hypothetical protein
MPNTTEHISIRLPSEMVAYLRAQAKTKGRSLAYIVAQHIRTVTVPTFETQVKRDGTNVHRVIYEQPIADSASVPITPECVECNRPLRRVNGKLVCCGIGCPMSGKEQQAKR